MRKTVSKVFAGHYINAHREACTFVDEVYGAPIRQETDLVIASCGGYPKDINIYQLQKQWTTLGALSVKAAS